MRQYNNILNILFSPRVSTFLCLWLGILVLSLAFLSPSPSFAATQSSKPLLVSSEPLEGLGWTWSAKSIHMSHKELDAPRPTIPGDLEIVAFRLKYKTTNLKGESVMASGLVRIRADYLETRQQKIPVISYQHSTRVKREDAPSMMAFDPESMAGAYMFASRGYLWAMPDLLGLGVNRDAQSYLHASGQAQVISDFLIAVEEWAKQKQIGIDKKIILMGYSQGGHNTLALQKFLESPKNRTGFRVAASFPMAGPYSVAGVGLEQSLKSKSSSQLLFVALALYGLSADPSLGVRLEEIINPKYEKLLPSLLSGKLEFDEVAAKLPKNAADFFSIEFLASVALAQEDNPVIAAFKKQDVIDFKAIAPVYLIHAPDDSTVLYANSKLAAKYLKKRGSQVELITLEENLQHEEAALPAFLTVLERLNKAQQ